MNFFYSLTKWGTDEFRDAVQTDLMQNEADLPLEDLCEEGGGPDCESLADFQIDAFDQDEEQIVVTATVYFQESVPTACKDANRKERRQGKLVIRIDKESGQAHVEAEFEGRNLEYY